MTTNPILRIIDAPTEALVDGGWAFMLFAAIAGTWWAAGRNLLWLDANWQDGWQYLPPFWVTMRIIALLVILGVDQWLLAALLVIVS